MKQAAPKRQRCAIYTRKSTEHNLDLAFNSLDAQREACAAYIKSQAHEGWTLVCDRFDDGGLSGASLDRPALQDLLNRVRARQVDIIVVYKVDRLTRSLADFAKLVELFDEHEVSFVSITQSFNTTSSMGRLTLNVLLSFAQFEREVIGERVRDKIAASKRKGIWVGGPVPLGYRSVDKKLEVVPEEADLVRRFFADYLEVSSIRALASRLNAQGQRPKSRKLANGKTIQAKCYRVGPLAHLLKNRFYIGEVVYGGEVHKGEHTPILERDLFDGVQARLKEQTVERRLARRRSSHLLTGKLFDDRANLMSPTHANKKGVRYRYYTSQALLQGKRSEVGSVSRVSATDVEKLVVEALRSKLDADPSISDRDLIDRHLDRATARNDCVEIASRTGEIDQHIGVQLETSSVPFTPKQLPAKGVAHAAAEPKPIDETRRIALLAAIARSRSWMDDLIQKPSTDLTAIARREGLAERHVRFLAPLAYLSPRVVEAIADGLAQTGLTASSLARTLPFSWREQEALLHIR
jgi:DNA invertase Pin-like site-specific DNA recombinase